MARKKRRSAPSSDIALDMTPMIDMVFNLIIFFMVITDMSQRDLEYLILPKADQAIEDDGKDPNRIVVNIVNYDNPIIKNRINKGELDPQLPPIMMGGRQFKDLDAWRRQLRALSNPTGSPLRELNGKPIGALGQYNGRDIYPSSKPCLIRCDGLQVFGWVQVVMQYCSFVPGRPRERELAESPLILKLEIAVAEKDQPQ